MSTPHCCLPTDPHGTTGHTGGPEGQDPTEPLPVQAVTCDFGGEVPTGINGTDTENWAA